MNVGDCLTPYIIEKMTGKMPVYAQGGADYQHYVMAGSMLNHAGGKAIVWGAGIATWTDGVDPNVKIHAVRGPISRMRAVNCGAQCPKVYGDPALILPKLYTPPSSKQHFMGVVGHYVDQFRVDAWYGDEVKKINVLQPVESFIDEVASCKYIVSSSLHGIIIAHSYGIPAVWVKISDSIEGDGTKYHDYYQSIGMEVSGPIDLRDTHFIPRSPDFVPDVSRVAANLWQACPIPMEARKPEYR